MLEDEGDSDFSEMDSSSDEDMVFLGEHKTKNENYLGSVFSL